MVPSTLMIRGRLSLLRHFACFNVFWLATACTHSTWDGRTYSGDSVRFHLGPVAPGWHRIEAENALLAFGDSARDLVVSVNGRCGKDSDDVPLSALTQHLFLYFTERRIVRQDADLLDGREALRTEMSAKLDGVARRFVVYVLKKDGCVYDFILIAAPSANPASIAEFDRFVLGFSTNASS
jgi:hypothetical protein